MMPSSEYHCTDSGQDNGIKRDEADVMWGPVLRDPYVTRPAAKLVTGVPLLRSEPEQSQHLLRTYVTKARATH